MDTSVLLKMPLFRGFTEKELSNALSSFAAKEQNFKKGNVILSAGSTPGVIGIVISGSITILSDDIWGNRTFHIAENSAVSPDIIAEYGYAS